MIEGALEDYVGTAQVHLIADKLWGGYPAWRREHGAGRNRMREVSADKAAELDARTAAANAAPPPRCDASRI